MLQFMPLKTSFDWYFPYVADRKYTDMDVGNGFIIRVYTVRSTDYSMLTHINQGSDICFCLWQITRPNPFLIC